MKKTVLILILSLTNVLTLVFLYTTHVEFKEKSAESQKLKLDIIELSKKNEETRKVAEQASEHAR